MQSAGHGLRRQEGKTRQGYSLEPKALPPGRAARTSSSPMDTQKMSSDSLNPEQQGLGSQRLSLHRWRPYTPSPNPGCQRARKMQPLAPLGGVRLGWIKKAMVIPLPLSPPEPGDSKWSSSRAGEAYQLRVNAYLSSSPGFVTHLAGSSWTNHLISLSLTFHISKVAITILASWGCYEN